MVWFKKAKQPKPIRGDRRRSTVPEGLLVKCEGISDGPHLLPRLREGDRHGLSG